MWFRLKIEDSGVFLTLLQNLRQRKKVPLMQKSNQVINQHLPIHRGL